MAKRARARGLAVWSVSMCVLWTSVGTAEAFINVEFRPQSQTVTVGTPVNIGVYLISDSAADQLFSAAQIIMTWNTSFLHLNGNSQAGAISLLSSGFPRPDPYGLNEATPPADGDAIYIAFANLGNPAHATPAGSLVTTLQFTAIGVTPLTPVDIQLIGGPQGRTEVFDGTTPNTDVTGTLRGSTVTIVPVPAPASLGVLGGVVFGALGRRRRS